MTSHSNDKLISQPLQRGQRRGSASAGPRALIGSSWRGPRALVAWPGREEKRKEERNRTENDRLIALLNVRAGFELS